MKKSFLYIIVAAFALSFGFYGCKKDEKVKEFTVTFNSNGGSQVSSQTVKDGEKATKPTDPIKDGNNFDGWFKETALTNAWNFATDAVTANITLYAKWNVIPPTPTKVTAAAIAGVTSPAALATPSTDVSNGTGFTASLAWNGNPATFDYGTAYTATITLTAASGYTFAGGFENTAGIAGFTVNGIAPA